MKKNLLLATSAMVATGFFATQAAAQIEVTLGGQLEFQAGYAFSEDYEGTGTAGMGGAQTLGGLSAAQVTAINNGTLDPYAAAGATPATRDGSFNSMTDNISLNFSNTADNGLTYGGQYRVDTGRVRTYVSGAFGRVNMGTWDSAAQALRVRVPHAGTDRFGGDAADYVFNAGIAGDGTEGNGGSTITYLSSGTALDDTGLTVGVSYSPNSTTSGISRTEATYNDVGTVAFEYDNEFSGVGVRFGAGYEFGSANSTFTTGDGAVVDYYVDNGGAGNVTQSGRNLSAFNVGAGISVAGFDVGAQYLDSGESGEISGYDNRTWAAGAAYSVGPWKFGVSYADGLEEASVTGTNAAGNATSANYKVEEQRLGFGTDYQVAEGLALKGDLAYIRSNWNASGDTNSGNDQSLSNDAWVGVVTTALSF